MTHLGSEIKVCDLRHRRRHHPACLLSPAHCASTLTPPPILPRSSLSPRRQCTLSSSLALARVLPPFPTQHRKMQNIVPLNSLGVWGQGLREDVQRMRADLSRLLALADPSNSNAQQPSHSTQTPPPRSMQPPVFTQPPILANGDAASRDSEGQVRSPPPTNSLSNWTLWLIANDTMVVMPQNREGGRSQRRATSCATSAVVSYAGPCGTLGSIRASRSEPLRHESW